MALGLAMAWMGLRRLFNRRLLAGGTTALIGAAFLSLAFASVGLLANIYTYQQLTAEQAVATLAFKLYSKQQFVVTLTPLGGSSREFNIYGDECQLDARIIKWEGWAHLFGLNTLYRLERLGGRYANSNQEQTLKRSVYALSERAGIELWEIANQLGDWLPWIDASYGNAVYLPMANGAKYRIAITTSGLVARPINAIAERAINNWK